jgi:predicted RNA-binding protein Jag
MEDCNVAYEEGYSAGVKAERVRILNMVPSERRMVHHVIATGSQEDLNDTFRRGYNRCRNDVLELLSDTK